MTVDMKVYQKVCLKFKNGQVANVENVLCKKICKPWAAVTFKGLRYLYFWEIFKRFIT